MDITVVDRFCKCGCGQETRIRKGRPLRFISGHNSRGANHYAWKGFSFIGGYKTIKMPLHPRAGSNGHVFEHILIAEKILGKSLPNKAVIHHPFGDKKSKIFIICENQAYHLFLHQRERAFLATGHVNWRKCRYCKNWDSPKYLSIDSHNGVYHILCKKKYRRKYYLKNGR